MVSIVSILDLVETLLNRRKNKLLLAAQSAMPADQFTSYRKQVLNELGKSRFRKDLEEELRKRLRTGKADGTERAGSYSQERGCHDE
jgi:hypothetical protein